MASQQQRSFMATVRGLWRLTCAVDFMGRQAEREEVAPQSFLVFAQPVKSDTRK